MAVTGLQIKWDANDTVYISGPPSERYVHWPLEFSASGDSGSVQATILVNATTTVPPYTITERTYGPLTFNTGVWTKFSPAILVDDAFFANPLTFELHAIAYNESMTSGQLNKSISNTLAPPDSGDKKLLYIAAGIALIIAGAGKRMLK